MIDERTKISIGLAISLIGGGMAWMTAIAAQTSSNTKTLVVMESRQVKYNESIQNIERDLAVVRTKIELMAERR